MAFEGEPQTKRFHNVAARIEAMIRNGEVAVGEYLPSEREMMARFGVGRPTIREALFTLQQSGRIKVTNGARARVVEPTAASLIQQISGGVLNMLQTQQGRDFLDGARVFFETGLARYAAEHATAQDLERLRRTLEANRLAVGRPLVFARTDADYHHALALIPGNPIFPAIQRGMGDWLTEQRMVTIEMPDADEISYADHAALFDAIAAHDADRAEQIMRDHLRFVAEVYRAVKQASREIFRDITRTIVREVASVRNEQRPAKSNTGRRKQISRA